ncbi:MAG: lipopolysaccharide kinase InaA family protein [Gammaproteobacteria bacterium]|nr:lipopolysaccharide kinase InaA family protein [Gammaproteobacteria bacterium]
MQQVDFNTDEFKQLQQLNNLEEFENIWSLETEWFEEPNYRRNGWSGVIKYPLLDATGKTIWVFIKRQENHNCKTALHPFKGVPTFRREYLNINSLVKQNIPTLTTFYYSERIVNGKSQAILITLSLEGYQSLEEFCANDENQSIPQRPEIMTLAGTVVRKLHDAHFRHNCLYAKHLFIKSDANDIDVRLIDLEKLKWLPLYSQIRRNDLSRIIRRGEPMTLEDLRLLLTSYYKSGNNLEQTSLAKKLNDLLESQPRYLSENS